MSAFSQLVLGSTVSIRSASRLGSRASTLSFLTLGSSLSLRSAARCGSSLSVLGKVSGSGKLSISQQGVCGSMVSLRSFARFGSNLSTFDALCLGSTLSVRGFCRCGSNLSVDTQLRVAERLYIGDNALNYVKYVGGIDSAVSKAYAFYADNGASASTRRLTFGMGTTNYLHGTWNSDATITTSDRRLKRNIRPLYEALLEEHARVTTGGRPGRSGAEIAAELPEPVAAHTFRQLRPVAFSMRSDVQAKRVSFGFIAQELQELYPSIVYKDDATPDGRLAVSYQDLIAIITLTLQQEMKRVDSLSILLENIENTAAKHSGILSTSEAKISALEIELTKLKDGYLNALIQRN